MRRIAGNARIIALAVALLPPGLAMGQAQAPASPSQPPQAPQESGSNAGKLTAGIIYGNNWMILFQHLPPKWNSDTDLANRLGVAEIFHPRGWNSGPMSPSIVVTISAKDPGVTIPSEMARDAENMRKNFPDCKITSAPPLSFLKRTCAPVRLFAYKMGWDKVVYSDGGKVIFLTTLHCEKAAQCAPFEPMFARFVRSLNYVKNIKVIDKTQ